MLEDKSILSQGKEWLMGLADQDYGNWENLRHPLNVPYSVE